MRNSVYLFAVLACMGGSPDPVQAAPATTVGAEQIAQLVTQLGSANFKDREAATQALEAIGGPALDALQEAALSRDPEVGRRAQSLARAIRRRIETQEFLIPLPLRLVYNETPVLRAVEDFAKRTKFPIEIVGSTAGLANRKITLDTGSSTFWEAFDQFCQKAGLVEGAAGLETDIQVNSLSLGAALRGQRALVQIVEAPLAGVSRAWDGRLLLVEGKQPRRPTDHAGAVRVRALPAPRAVGHSAAEPVLFVVEITPQPRLGWQHILDLRIEKALDEEGQDLAPFLETHNDWSQVAATGSGNGAALWDAQTGQPLAALRDIPVRLKSGNVPSGILKEVKGAFTAQVQTPPQTILAMDNILKSTGRVVVGDEGESLKLAAVESQPTGDVRVQVEISDGSATNVVWAMRRGILRPNGRLVNGGGRRGPIAIENGSPITLVLQDGEGHSFPLSGQSEDLLINGNVLTRQISCTFQTRAGLGEPQKLVYSGRRTMIIEVPFTLNDVPLP